MVILLAMTVRPVAPDDAPSWLRMRCALWPDGSESEHADEIAQFFARRERAAWEVLVAEREAGHLAGMVELAIRPFAEGCVTSKVAYLEGWFVVPAARRRGVGSALVLSAEAWGRAQGCTEFASDAEAGNATSIAAHRALGFAETALIRCFRKNL